MILFAFGTRPEYIKIKPIIDNLSPVRPRDLFSIKLGFFSHETDVSDEEKLTSKGAVAAVVLRNCLRFMRPPIFISGSVKNNHRAHRVII